MKKIIREILNTYPKRWMVYVYRGNIIIKEGIIYEDLSLPYHTKTFYPNNYYEKKYCYTQLADKPLVYSGGKVWCESEDDIPKAISIIKQHYRIRKEQLENSEALDRAINVLNHGTKKKISILKLCPFCGSECDINKKIRNKGFNKSGIVPEGAVIYNTTTRIRRIKDKTTRKYISEEYTIYYWHKYKYIPRCTNTDCILSTDLKGYNTLMEAIKAWNIRKWG